MIVTLVAVAGTAAPSLAATPMSGTWSGGCSVGVLGTTPDGTAFATNLHADYFVTKQLSPVPVG